MRRRERLWFMAINTGIRVHGVSALRYRDCRYPRPLPRPVYRLEGNGGGVEQRYESQYLRY